MSAVFLSSNFQILAVLSELGGVPQIPVTWSPVTVHRYCRCVLKLLIHHVQD